MKRKVLCILSALVLFWYAPLTTAIATGKQIDKDEGELTITGCLVLEDKSPVPGMNSYFIPLASDDNKKKVESPKATTDGKGRFSVKTNRALFSINEFVIAVGSPPRLTFILNSKGEPKIFRIDSRSKLDLGTVKTRRTHLYGF